VFFKQSIASHLAVISISTPDITRALEGRVRATMPSLSAQILNFDFFDFFSQQYKGSDNPLSKHFASAEISFYWLVLGGYFSWLGHVTKTVEHPELRNREYDEPLTSSIFVR
jgi:hypothetical protein